MVIRHLYDEDGVEIPEDARTADTDVNEAFDVCDVQATEIKIPEGREAEIKSEQQVRILGFFNRCQYFPLVCT